MSKTIHYYLSLISPWTYMGGERVITLAERYDADLVVRPMALATVFPATGGLPLAKRAPERQAYRLVELERWHKRLGVPLNLHPLHFPADERLAAGMVVAAQNRGLDAAHLAQAFLRGVWAEERDIADVDTLIGIAGSLGLDGPALVAESKTDAIAEAYDANSKAAIEAGVFGAPSYVVDGELFWGQDRLDFLEEKLAEG